MDGLDLQIAGAVRMARVIAVSPAEVVALLERQPDGSVVPIEMGALVKLVTRASIVFGMVNALRVPLPSLVSSDEDLKIIEIEMLGEMLRNEDGSYDAFRRGVAVFPAIESPVYVTTDEDVAQVFAPPHTGAEL